VRERVRQADRLLRGDAERRHATQEKIRAEKERIAAAERRRRDALMAEASRWNSAQILRDYVTHIRAAAAAGAESSTSTTAAWTDWALQVAPDLDPTPSRLSNSVADEKAGDSGARVGVLVDSIPMNFKSRFLAIVYLLTR
jgi:hypothetical protein